jgi:hypothetical protein
MSPDSFHFLFPDSMLAYKLLKTRSDLHLWTTDRSKWFASHLMNVPFRNICPCWHMCHMLEFGRICSEKLLQQLFFAPLQLLNVVSWTSTMITIQAPKTAAAAAFGCLNSTTVVWYMSKLINLWRITGLLNWCTTNIMENWSFNSLAGSWGWNSLYIFHIRKHPIADVFWTKFFNIAMHNLKTKKEDFQILLQIMEWLLQLAFFTDFQIQYNNFCSAKNDFTNN